MTSKFCKKCQTETDRNATGRCKACSNAAGAVRRAANPDEGKVYHAAWRAKNHDKVKAAGAAYYAANADRVKVRGAAYYAENIENIYANKAVYYAANREKLLADKVVYNAANRDKAKARGAAWYAANSEHVKALKTAWRAANPEAVRIHSQNRRARKHSSGGVLSQGLSAKLFKLQRGKCACGCKQSLGEAYHLDHVLPLSLGGPNTDDNIQLLRSACNLQKYKSHPIDFMQQKGFLL